MSRLKVVLDFNFALTYRINGIPHPVCFEWQLTNRLALRKFLPALSHWTMTYVWPCNAFRSISKWALIAVMKRTLINWPIGTSNVSAVWLCDKLTCDARFVVVFTLLQTVNLPSFNQAGVPEMATYVSLKSENIIFRLLLLLNGKWQSYHQCICRDLTPYVVSWGIGNCICDDVKWCIVSSEATLNLISTLKSSFLWSLWKEQAALLGGNLKVALVGNVLPCYHVSCILTVRDERTHVFLKGKSIQPQRHRVCSWRCWCMLSTWDTVCRWVFIVYDCPSM